MKGWANLCTQIIHKCMGGRETGDEMGEKCHFRYREETRCERQ